MFRAIFIQNMEDGIYTNNDEEDDSDMNDNTDNRFQFATSEPVDDTIEKNNLSEDQLIIQDAKAASFEHNRAASNWIAYDVPWKQLCNKR